MKFELTSVEKKTSKTGKSYAVVFAKDESGKEFKASVWEGSDTIAVGQSVEGELQASGDFLNLRLASAKPNPQPWRGASRRDDIKAAVEQKQAGIALAQEAKEAGIKVSLAMRMATDVALAARKDQPFPTDAEFKAEWNKWYDYFGKMFTNELDRAKQDPF